MQVAFEDDDLPLECALPLAVLAPEAADRWGWTPGRCAPLWQPGRGWLCGPGTRRQQSKRRELGQDAAALASAYDREYNDDHSWEQLQEDEHGRLINRVRVAHHRGSGSYCMAPRQQPLPPAAAC